MLGCGVVVVCARGQFGSDEPGKQRATYVVDLGVVGVCGHLGSGEPEEISTDFSQMIDR